ncbi:MAG: hypothetical protein NXI32_31295 [bacterium]|nr:hypothetical protein [bacterium]
MTREPNTLVDDDGYTLTRYIEGRAGLYGPLRFTYRPVGAMLRAKFLDKRQATQLKYLQNAQAKCTELLCEITASRITEWDAIDHKQNGLALSPANLRKLHPLQLARLWDIVIWGEDAGDPDPDLAQAGDEDEGWLTEDLELVEAEQKNS